MRKIITLLAVIGIFSLQGCMGPEGVPGTPGRDGLITEVFELKNVNFAYDVTEGYLIYQKFIPILYASDVVLIYRLSGTLASGAPIWQPIPRTLFLPQGELDYDFDFSRTDFTIYAGGTYNLASTPQYLNNQTFRIVIVPGSFAATLNKNSYHSVMEALNINESQVRSINF